MINRLVARMRIEDCIIVMMTEDAMRRDIREKVVVDCVMNRRLTGRIVKMDMSMMGLLIKA